MKEFEKYKAEAEEKWGETAAYKEYAEKTKDYSKDKWTNLTAGMDNIFVEFAVCKEKGGDALGLVKKLQEYISANYYACTNEILAGLGQMYTADERFRNSIDKHADGTAEFVSRAIEAYCAK